ncbi:DUF1697 domain-containing protein [Cognatiyoonia sp. IB215446]|uniref:DUF1697 domain-containing protein n=1 Tax=Cognatiyoonia sp. IB215446 TaxID=3097355 RepID=UPI002A14BDFB|nr:DUF1697 domain-containing protein [Cognatiyoonia sp. IB215446]MDX8348762.1 DUF1697 domain-containing protein [Cognatiyoonia sp. IB215446]
MQTLIALLRAVNVGGTGKLPMAELRAMADAAGLADVRTYIQSGNLVCRSSDPPETVKSSLEARLAAYAGKAVDVFVRSSQEIGQIIDTNPFADSDPKRLGVLFLDVPAEPAMVADLKGQKDERVVCGVREIYIHYPSGMGTSKLQLPNVPVATMRNLNTVRRLAEMAAGDA